MNPTYAAAKQTADRILKSKGQPVSVLVINDAGVSRTMKTVAAVFDIEIKYADGKTIFVGDKRLIMSAVGLSAPVDTTSRITIGGVPHAVIDAGPFAPAGDVLFYKSIVRAGG